MYAQPHRSGPSDTRAGPSAGSALGLRAEESVLISIKDKIPSHHRGASTALEPEAGEELEVTRKVGGRRAATGLY